MHAPTFDFIFNWTEFGMECNQSKQSLFFLYKGCFKSMGLLSLKFLFIPSISSSSTFNSILPSEVTVISVIDKTTNLFSTYSQIIALFWTMKLHLIIWTFPMSKGQFLAQNIFSSITSKISTHGVCASWSKSDGKMNLSTQKTMHKGKTEVYLSTNTNCDFN